MIQLFSQWHEISGKTNNFAMTLNLNELFSWFIDPIISKAASVTDR